MLEGLIQIIFMLWDGMTPNFGFEALTAVAMRSIGFWVIMPCYGGPACYLLLLVSCLAYSFNPEDGGNMFLRMLSSANHGALQPRWLFSVTGVSKLRGVLLVT
jgi:hypothetical protein